MINYQLVRDILQAEELDKLVFAATECLENILLASDQKMQSWNSNSAKHVSSSAIYWYINDASRKFSCMRQTSIQFPNCDSKRVGINFTVSGNGGSGKSSATLHCNFKHVVMNFLICIGSGNGGSGKSSASLHCDSNYVVMSQKSSATCHWSN